MVFFGGLGTTQGQAPTPLNYGTTQMQPPQQGFGPQHFQPVQQILLLAKSSDPQKPPQPAAYSTRWEDLHPESQRILLQIEEKIIEYRDESVRLEQCQRLQDSPSMKNDFQEEIGRIAQDLASLQSSFVGEEASLQPLLAICQQLTQFTEYAMRVMFTIYERYPSLKPGNQLSPPLPTPGTMGAMFIASSTETSGPRGPSNTLSPFTIGISPRPDPFLEHSVGRMEAKYTDCQQMVEELEKVLRPFARNRGIESDTGDSSLAEVLPNALQNLHQFFVHVAAKVESLHVLVESARSAFLAQRRRQGNTRDPFVEADRREAAKKEAASKALSRGLPQPSQPSQQTLQVTSAGTAPVPLGPSPARGTTSPGFSLFGSAPSAIVGTTPTVGLSSGAPSGSSLLGTPPSTSQFGGGASLFGSFPAGGAASGSSLFGASSGTTSIFGAGSTPAFGTPTPSGNAFGGFGQTAAGTFGNPTPSPATGCTFGGYSPSFGGVATQAPGQFGFNNTPSATKPKPRTNRRK